MKDAFASEIAEHRDDPEVIEILRDVCRTTGMGFAAVACVTEDRWVACQVLDKIEFGLRPGDELDIATTICNDVRKGGERVVIDHVQLDRDWCMHPIPILYGFQSYASLPLRLDDGSYYGTLCAIDPAPRLLQTEAMIEALESCARRAERVLSRRVRSAPNEARQACGSER